MLDADDRACCARLRAVLVGGAACPLPWLEECAERGVVALTTYGLTEACSQVTAQRPPRPGAPPRAAAGSGQPLAGTSFALPGTTARELLAGGATGRILVRGPTLMRGYAGARAALRGAWFDTGDVGCRDEQGTLFVEGRRTELDHHRGRERFSCRSRAGDRRVHGGARSDGVRRARRALGAAGGACSLEIDPSRFTGRRLAAELAARLAAHKRPRRFAVVDRLPQTAAGKPTGRGGPHGRWSRELRFEDREPRSDPRLSSVIRIHRWRHGATDGLAADEPGSRIRVRSIALTRLADDLHRHEPRWQ